MMTARSASGVSGHPPLRSSTGPPLASTSLPPSAREFPYEGFQVIDPDVKVEEERLPFYQRQNYYPMRIGQIVQDQFQVVAKLGFGTTSTVWLSRDLITQEYWVLKVYINSLQNIQELKVYQHLEGFIPDENTIGKPFVRQLQASFNLKGPYGDHQVLVMKPLGMSLRTLQEFYIQKDKVFEENLVTGALDQVLLGLDYLHEAKVIHTDLHSDNLLIDITDTSVLSNIEEQEVAEPSARKRDTDRYIYVSRYMLAGAGSLIISDLGQAHIGEEHHGKAMPLPYRAPEVILCMPWGNKVDSWSVALLTWDLLERKSLFTVYDTNSEEQNDAHHLAAMTALLGPPPSEFLQMSKETSKYWDQKGEWHGPIPLPPKTTLNELAGTLKGTSKENFLDFMECFLCWLPQDRLKAHQGYFHPWLREKNGGTKTMEGS
ncbi:unnamed protein product [Clonostachys rosea f. rosea IK726]|uniref:Protein kinase domain-containing protein n=3 Tax=Bionectria ochroleuca TaxID=29856 RepID=A0A0B7JQE6_BIOOC|nr:unnamed protein product [Clonostachys rosea f. rosea IK726]